MADQNGVFIHQREMFDLIQDMAKGQQRIEARLDSMETNFKSLGKADERSREALDLAEDVEKDNERLKSRVKNLEDRQWWLWGAIALLGLKTLVKVIGG
ncbi:hypothetical protein [Paludifilum halophilum]|uniref:Holin n=1 Tax=Paludifilum halophilum TaxID=1642702 RepID=A0A235B7L4_9BACL|nr:hypothetical protein [Paludifilum halophilum]OYD07585.1 hypothetical protein CHM34_08855 [Paludifilum halophilum]